MTKKRWLWVIPGLFLLLFVVCYQADRQQGEQLFTCELFEINEGWGYSIYRADRIIIHQPCIPCKPGNKPFPTQEAAEETGKLVLSKLQNNELPAVSGEELESILIKE